jgi:hypothetical protein
LMGLALGQRCPERDATSLNPFGQRGQWKASFQSDALNLATGREHTWIAAQEKRAQVRHGLFSQTA